MEDVVVVGAGPAGLSAALWLGRYRRRTVVIDAARQRNLAAGAAHGYLTRDGVTPQGFLDLARADIAEYDSVRLITAEVKAITGSNDDFAVEADGSALRAHRIVLANGVEDVFPEIPGFERFYGRGIFHCSCCDGYETRGRRVVAIGWGEHAAGFALDLLDWGAEVTLLTDGREFEGDEVCRSSLARHGIDIVTERVVDIEAEGDDMRGMRLSSGGFIECSRAFFSIAHRPRTDLARSLGCDIDDEGYVVIDAHGATTVDGIYAAGDVTPGEQLIQVAASQGAITGIACAMSLRGMRTRSPAPDPGPDPHAETTP